VRGRLCRNSKPETGNAFAPVPNARASRGTLSTCPNCGAELQTAQTGESFCPQCHLVGAQTAPQPRRPSASDYVRRFPATTFLIAVNVLVFLAMVASHVSPSSPTTADIIKWGGDSGEKIFIQDQWWRVITSAFVHIGGAHLLMNMWALWVLGTLAEAILGTWLYLGLYLVCAVAGSLTGVFWHPLVVGAGASGAIMGILGAEVSVLKFAHLPLPKEVLRSTMRSLVQGAVLTLVIGALPRIDNAAHVGGLVCGLLIGLLLSLTRRAGQNVQRPLRAICLIVPFAAMVPLALAAQRHSEPRIHLTKAEEALGVSQFAQAEKEARAALRHLPNQDDVLAVLGTALYYQGNDAEAVKYMRQLFEQDSRNDIATNVLASIELKQKDAIGARDLLSKSLPMQPQNAYGQVLLGRALQQLNQDNEAMARYRQAIQLESNLYDAQIALASIYEKHNEPKNAILFYKKAAQIHPNDIEPLRGLARSYLQAGMKQQADQTIAEIRKREASR
jgi:rhomboid protease GluP